MCVVLRCNSLNGAKDNTSPERVPSLSACSFCANELTHTHANGVKKKNKGKKKSGFARNKENYLTKLVRT